MADPLVKSVMMLLVLASIWCWAIIVEKINSVRHERRNSDAFEDAFWSGGSADALYDEIGGDPRDAKRRSPKAPPGLVTPSLLGIARNAIDARKPKRGHPRTSHCQVSN